MAKIKDFLTKLKEQGKINHADYDKALETAPDWEFPDTAIAEIEKNFLTIDRASVHKDVHGKIRREVLDPVDNDIKKILTVLDQYDKFTSSEIDKEESTYSKLQKLTAALPGLINKVKATPTTDEETKKKLKESTDSVTELMARIEKINLDYIQKEKTLQTESEKKIHDYKLSGELEKLANGFKFAKPYSDDTVRKDITKVKLDKLRGENFFSLVEKDGQYAVSVIDKDGKPRFKENSNDPVTVNNLLEDAFKPYIKVNNVDGDDNSDDGEAQVTNRFKVQEGKTQTRTGARTTVS